MIERWIVVGGSPRSGTTLVGNALGAAGTAIVTPESQFASEALRAVAEGRLRPEPGAVIDYVGAHWRYGIWNHPLPDDWPDLSHHRDGADLVWAVLRHLVESYARRHGKPGATVWIDHTPEHLAAVPRLAPAGLDLRGVHVLRDGRAVAASVLKVDWGPSTISRLAHWWVGKVAEALAAQRLLEGRTETLRYEDLVTAPAAELARLCAGLGLEYSDAMLSSRALEVVEYTAAQHTKVGKAMDPQRIHAWKTALPARDQEIFESIAGQLLDLLGYERLYPQARPASLGERLVMDYLQSPLRRRLRKLGVDDRRRKYRRGKP